MGKFCWEAACDLFDIVITGKLSARATEDDCEKLGANTPCYESYHDDSIMTQASNGEEDFISVRKQLPEPAP